MDPIDVFDSFLVVHDPERVRDATELDSPVTVSALMPVIVRLAADEDSASMVLALQERIVPDEADEHSMSSLLQFIASAVKEAALDTSISTLLEGKDKGPFILIEAAEFASKSLTAGAVTITVTLSSLFIFVAPLKSVTSLLPLILTSTLSLMRLGAMTVTEVF